MSRIKKIEKLTDSKYLNLYQLEAVNRLGERWTIMWHPGLRRLNSFR